MGSCLDVGIVDTKTGSGKLFLGFVSVNKFHVKVWMLISHICIFLIRYQSFTLHSTELFVV